MVETLVVFHDPIVSRDERRRTGKHTAGILVLVFCFLGLYHAFIRQNVALASLVMPVFIMTSYLCWVLHLAKKVERIKISLALDSTNKQENMSSSSHQRTGIQGMSSEMRELRASWRNS